MSNQRTIDKSEVELAISDMSNCRQTHVVWAEYFEKYPEAERTYGETVHPAKEQREIIAQYDRVLRILNSLRDEHKSEL